MAGSGRIGEIKDWGRGFIGVFSNDEGTSLQTDIPSQTGEILSVFIPEPNTDNL